MKWLEEIANTVEQEYPNGEVLVSSGVSPSGKYHVGTLREVLTADAIFMILKKRGRKISHIHFVDDLDVFRKIPSGVPESFSKYLGMPLCDVPSPNQETDSYADYFLEDFISNVDTLGIDMKVFRSHEKYRQGFFVPSIETALDNIEQVRFSIESSSNRKLGEEWSPIQIIEDEYLKKRPYVSIDKNLKLVTYLDKHQNQKQVSYKDGQVKLDWRIDWPARWWQLGVNVEPFGRDHATKGGSYDTGVSLMKNIFKAKAPIPVPYQFINRAGETKKMSKSAGNTVTISELLEVLPPEIVRFFVLRYPPNKTLFFDQTDGVVRLIDEYAELLSKKDKTPEDDMLIYICSSSIKGGNTISDVPFSHLVASYQAALKDKQKTLDIISRTEHKHSAKNQKEIILKELEYIDAWLNKWAGDDVKFSLRESTKGLELSGDQEDYLKKLALKIQSAPENADGEWFHKTIYDFKETSGLSPKQLFTTLYHLLINKSYGPRLGWFLSILPRDWLIKRLRLED